MIEIGILLMLCYIIWTQHRIIEEIRSLPQSAGDFFCCDTLDTDGKT